MKKRIKKLLALLLSASFAMSVVACGSTNNNVTSETAKNPTQSSETESTVAPEGQGSDELTTLTVLTSGSHFSGIIEGYRGEFFAQHGIQLDLWSWSEDKLNAILASGDLPDIIYYPTESKEALIEGNMLLNIDDYVDQIPNLTKYADRLDPALNYIREYASAGTGELYGLPTMVGDSRSKYAIIDSTGRFYTTVLWEAYSKAGHPKITDLDSLADAMELMLEAMPTDADGNPMYGGMLHSSNDAERGYWYSIQRFLHWYGYSEYYLKYLYEANMITGELTSILDESSLYYKGLKWYNDLYRRGLLDPDSLTGDGATQQAKMENYQVMVPIGGNAGWPTNWLPICMEDTQIFYNESLPYGLNFEYIGVNAKTENLDACLKFLDLMADPDTHLYLQAGMPGPDEYWNVDENGVATFTERGMKYIEEVYDYAFFPLSSGEELGYSFISTCYQNGELTNFKDERGGYRCADTKGWYEFTEYGAFNNENFAEWQKVTGYNSWKEWLEAEDALVTESELFQVNTFLDAPDEDMQLIVDAVRDKVTTGSWKAVYAESDAEFDAAWNQMIADCKGLGGEDLQKWCLDQIVIAKERKAALE